MKNVIELAIVALLVRIVLLALAFGVSAFIGSLVWPWLLAGYAMFVSGAFAFAPCVWALLGCFLMALPFNMVLSFKVNEN